MLIEAAQFILAASCFEIGHIYYDLERKLLEYICVGLPREEMEMQNSRLIGGVILMLAAAGIFFFKVTDYSTPAAITLLILGIALTATARRG